MAEDAVERLRTLEAEAVERSAEWTSRRRKDKRVSNAIEAAVALTAITVGGASLAEAEAASAGAAVVLFCLLGTALGRMGDPRRREIANLEAAWTRHAATAADLIARHEASRTASGRATLNEWTRTFEAEVQRTRHGTDVKGQDST